MSVSQYIKVQAKCVDALMPEFGNVVVYDTILQCANEHGIPKSTLHKHITNDNTYRGHHKGWIFRASSKARWRKVTEAMFVDMYDIGNGYKCFRNIRLVSETKADGLKSIVIEWDSIQDAAKAGKLKYSTIYYALVTKKLPSVTIGKTTFKLRK